MTTARASSVQPTARTFEVSVTRRIEAPAHEVYEIFADYHRTHPRVLPPSFFTRLTVEAGGYGAGTAFAVDTRFAGRDRTMRGVVTEAEPGRKLVERYADDGVVTTFLVDPVPGADASVAAITSTFPRRRGVPGWIEEIIARRLLRRVYAEVLERAAGLLARDRHG